MEFLIFFPWMKLNRNSSKLLLPRWKPQLSIGVNCPVLLAGRALQCREERFAWGHLLDWGYGDTLVFLSSQITRRRRDLQTCSILSRLLHKESQEPNAIHSCGFSDWLCLQYDTVLLSFGVGWKEDFGSVWEGEQVTASVVPPAQAFQLDGSGTNPDCQKRGS